MNLVEGLIANAWNVAGDKSPAHSDFIEMSGLRVSLDCTFAVAQDRTLVLGRKLSWPSLRVQPNKTHGTVSASFGEDAAAREGASLRTLPRVLGRALLPDRDDVRRRRDLPRLLHRNRVWLNSLRPAPIRSRRGVVASSRKSHPRIRTWRDRAWSRRRGRADRSQNRRQGHCSALSRPRGGSCSHSWRRTGSQGSR